MPKVKNTETASLIDLMFQAFCHRIRLRILHLLQEGEMCVGNIVKILQAPQPKVSRHLAVMKRAKLVQVRRDGQWVHYSLAPVQSTFHRKLLECAANCFDEVPEIQGDKARIEEMRTLDTGCCPLPQDRQGSPAGRTLADVETVPTRNSALDDGPRP